LVSKQAEDRVGLQSMKDRQILIVGNFLSHTTGSRGVCEDLAEHLSSSGWTVFTTSDSPDRMARLLDMLKTVWSRRDDYKIATIDTFSGPAFFWAEAICLALRRLGKPYVLILHGGNLPGFAQRWPRRVSRLLRTAAVVTAPSQYLIECMKPYRPDILLFQNPIDIRKYTFNLRREPRPTLVWLRAFHAIYNAPMAVQVVNRIIPEYPDSHLLMGGDDKDDGSLEKTKEMARLLGVSNSIEFCGKIPNLDVPSWLQRGDIFINTTNIDNAPVSVIEAMACGLCIVSTNVGGIPYLLKDGEDALLVPPDDPQAMATAVKKILKEPGLAEKISNNARCKAEWFDWSIVFHQWEKLFLSIGISDEQTG
jgi:glycosyltransferase involved in cell wall biosynthesis